MVYEPEDQEIIRLLTKLKNAEQQYPEQMLLARRELFFQQMANVGLGIESGAEGGLEPAVESASPPSVPPVASGLLEIALVAAIILEAGAVAYFYRDRLADFFQTLTTQPRVQVVTPPPVFTDPLEIESITPSPVATPTPLSATPSGIPTGTIPSLFRTPQPEVAGENNSSNASGSQINSTPAASEKDKSNQGNHYGQTPKPERTKENNGSGGKAPKDNANPPPQDNTGQSSSANNNKPKPTKTK